MDNDYNVTTAANTLPPTFPDQLLPAPRPSGHSPSSHHDESDFDNELDFDNFSGDENASEGSPESSNQSLALRAVDEFPATAPSVSPQITALSVVRSLSLPR